MTILTHMSQLDAGQWNATGLVYPRHFPMGQEISGICLSSTSLPRNLGCSALQAGHLPI